MIGVELIIELADDGDDDDDDDFDDDRQLMSFVYLSSRER